MIGSGMVATTQYFSKELYKRLAEVARAQKKSNAQLVREAVEEKVMKEPMSNAASLYRAFKRIQKVFPKGGPNDLASNHDHYAWD